MQKLFVFIKCRKNVQKMDLISKMSVVVPFCAMFYPSTAIKIFATTTPFTLHILVVIYSVNELWTCKLHFHFAQREVGTLSLLFLSRGLP